MKRRWKQGYAGDEHVAEECEKLTNDEWTIFSITPIDNTMDGDDEGQQAVLIVAWREDPVVEPGKPTPPVRMP